MDAGPRSSSNNVTVEYTDPSGLFSSVNPLLSEILPLRNLHWKSPTRPLRSIDSLHIDFVPTQNTAEEQKRLSDGSGSAAVSQRRRHQIPGLRQTPYLKIYLLRCDDNEAYKSTSRKLVREWIKSRATPAQGSSSGSAANQDNHDAFEWIIIHVVPAGSDTAREKTPASKWPGRGTTSVLEKVKADFNGSSKSSVDRVVQLKLPMPDEEQKSSELTVQLEDLVAKLKSSILTSFDLRVSQYEEDIREKDSQRALPGWNFCTFFILKEGLSLGFENVGLYEDALVGYDELSVGLDLVLRDQSQGFEDQHGGTFLSYSKDIKTEAENVLDSIGSSGGESSDDGDSESSDDQAEGEDAPAMDGDPLAIEPDIYPLNANKKPYRDMILANNISVFDFSAYIFSRQLLLLLKAASTSSGRRRLSSAERQVKGAEDLSVLSEICHRANQFIPQAARTLRYDLMTGLAQSEHEYAEASKREIIDNMVSSWVVSAISQILTQTSTSALEIPNVSIRNPRDLINASIVIPFAESRPGIPKRTSSLQPTSPTGARSPAQEVISGIQKQIRAPLISLNEDDPGQKKAGAIGLVSSRGELYFLARSTLESVGRKRNWGGQGWKGLSLLYFEGESAESQFAQVSLDDGDGTPAIGDPQTTQPVLGNGLDNPCLTRATRSAKQYDAVYAKMTDDIFCHNTAAEKSRSAELALADMALLKYRSGDYSTAASYFHHLAAFYRESKWEELEGATTELYSRCLKHLNRQEDYLHALLALLALYASTERAKSQTMVQTGKRFSSLVPSSFSTIARDKVSSYLAELYESSRSLSSDVTVRLADFFGSIAVDPRIQHFKDQDGFQVQLSLRFVLGDGITVDGVKMRLVNASDPQTGELWLENEGEVTIKSSPTRILLNSNATVEGRYLVDHFELRMGKIIFSRRYRFEDGETPSLQDIIPENLAEKEPPFVMCYPPADGFEAKVTPSRFINLSEPRRVDIEIKSGWNEIVKGSLRVKPATAGLRLVTSDVSIVSGSINLRPQTGLSAGALEFEDLPPNSTAALSIPYTVEESHNTLLTRIEVSYETPRGRFSYATTSWVMATLPVSVNVQDVFKDDVLFSRFTVSPSMMIPIRMLECQMGSLTAYDVQSSMCAEEAFDVFPKQPASLIYKIRQRNDDGADGDGTGSGPSSSSSRTLRLKIEFTCLNEECLSVLEQRFTDDISASPFRPLKHLLLRHMLQTFSTKWTARDLETIGLTREIEMFSYERFQWRGLTKSIGGDAERQVTEWLTEWHKNNQTIPLPPQIPSIARRELVIPVDIPEIQVVHTAELVLPPTPTGNAHWAVGSMIPAELHLRHTRRWCPPSTREPQPELSFSYEIMANPDLWLVGGRRRGNFTATEEEGEKGCVFQVLLLPQRAGSLLLPGVDVKTFGRSTTTSSSSATETGGQTEGAGQGQGHGQGSTPARRQIPCEVDYKNHGEAVVVSPDLGKTTVGLRPPTAENPGTMGAWFVASERRTAANG